MTTPRQLRKTALGLADTAEDTSADGVDYSVRGRSFASLVDGVVALPMSAEDAATTRADIAAAEPLDRGTGVRVALDDVNGMQLNALVRRAWAHRAPRDLTEAAAAAERAADSSDGDLPSGLGRPATRALHEAGIDSLDEVARRTEDDLVALHGVGPKAVRVLRSALAETGRTLDLSPACAAPGPVVRGGSSTARRGRRRAGPR